MGTISSSGLVSGMDIASIVQQLMDIESRPLTLIKARVEETNNQKLAYETVNAQLLAVLASIGRLAETSAFTARSATSSNPDALSVSAAANTPVGSYSFLVRSIVSTHQMASLGYADRTSTPVGAGTLSFEPAGARVDPDTELGSLNGGAGVRRGQIRITDRAGASTTVDLRSAYTVGDVLEAVNSQSQAAVRAYLSQDRIVIEDITGLGEEQGQLAVTNVGAGMTATDLGIAGTESGTGQIISSADLVRLTATTSLASLNDGLGVGYSSSASDLRFTLASGRVFEVDFSDRFSFDTSLAELNAGQGVGPGSIRITNKAGVSAVIDLTGNETINEIQDKLASEYSQLQVTFTSASGSGGLTLSDSSGGTGHFKVEDVTGTIASQLKLAADTEEANITGRVNYQFTTINSLIRRIQYARDTGGGMNGGELEIALAADGKGLAVIDHTSGTTATSIEALNGSKALEDLGLDGTFQNGTLSTGRLVSGMNTVLLRNLNGGAGVRTGVAQFQLRDGTTRTVDFTGAETLQDVVNRINEEALLKAEVSAGGTGLIITDNSTGTGNFAVSGDTLTDLHVIGSSATGRLAGGDLNRKYISESTLLSGLNGGKGIGLKVDDASSTVEFQVTNSAGERAVVTLAGNRHRTVGDVIAAINEAMSESGVQATINANGDGIELYESTAAGTGRLSVSEVAGGTAAAALHIKGEASAQEPRVLTGSFAGTIQVGAADTLDDVMNAINAADLNVRASIINDGSASRPYRLVLTSTVSGTAGEIAFSGGGTGLAFETLTQAEDARVVLGNLDSSSSIVVSSSSNKITEVVQGLTLELTAPSPTPIQVNVNQNVDSIVNEVNSFISAYNATLDRIDELTKFVPDTNERGILLGDGAVLQIRDRLYRQVSRTLPLGYEERRLSSVGITYVDRSGGRLQLNETVFRDAVTTNPDAVKELFTKVTTTTDPTTGKEKVQYVGIAANLKQELRNLTGSGGLLGLQTNRLDERVELYNRRIEDMQRLLEQKETRYYAQFQAMEKALSQMQSQQSSLASLSNMLSSLTMGGQ
jgi:flagellar hook-associated protein 2